MLSRIQKLQEIIKKQNADAILITNQTNIQYLTGFVGISSHDRESTCLVTRKTAYLFIPRMYEEQAKRLSSVQNKNINLIVDEKHHGLLTLFTSYINNNDTIILESHHVTLAEYEKIKKTINHSVCLKPDKKDHVKNLRTIKDQTEINQLTKAAHITDQTFNQIVAILQKTDPTELTELDLVAAIRSISDELGGEGFGFDPIVASGPSSAEPHYRTKKNKLLANEPLLLDFGIVYQGYTADLTRTIYLGKPTEKYLCRYKLVLECNQLCIDAVKPGVTGQTLDHIAMDFFQKNHVDNYVLHSLGHGVGLNIHENPGINHKSIQPLETGNVITIEPGLYFSEEYGIRLEDLILVTKEGCEILSKNSTK